MQEKKKSGPVCCGQNSRKLRFYRGVSYVALCLGIGGGLAGLELENSAQAAICFLPDCADKLEAFQGDANTSAQYCLDLGYVYYELGQCPPYYATEVCSGNDHYLKCDAAKWCEDNGYQLEVDDCVTPTYADEQCLNGLRFYKQCKVDYDKACHEEDADYVSECRDGWIFDSNELCSYSPLYGKCCNECADYPYEEDEIPQGYQKGESCQACGNVIKYKKELYDCAAEGFIRCDKGGQTGAEVCWSGNDKWYKECCAPCDDYPYLESQIPEGYVKGESCDSCDGMKYKLKSGECAAGYVWANNSCVICDETCSVGNILYSDMTCNSCNVSGKTPIGVISYARGSARLVLQLTAQMMQWGGYGVNILNLTKYSSGDNALTDFNGKNNTDLIVKTLGDSSNYAAGYCYNYTTKGTTKGQWYLPAAGELYASISANSSLVNKGLSTIGVGILNVGPMIWSSSSGGGNYGAWSVRYISGDVLGADRINANLSFRCVLPFEDNGDGTANVCGEEYKYSCAVEGNVTGGSGSTCGGMYQSCQCASGYEWKNGACVSSCPTSSCAVGDILYSDKTCSSSCTISGKTPIGVVSYVNGSRRLAIQLNDLGYSKFIYWCSSYGACQFKDISGIPNYNSADTSKTDFNGKANTKAYYDTYGDTCADYAPGYCYNYTTEGTSKGDWYLPAMGELYESMYVNREAVTSGLIAAGGYNVTTTRWYFSSSEAAASPSVVWAVRTEDGYVSMLSKYSNSYVLCVLSF